jgi:hypothetical protein
MPEDSYYDGPLAAFEASSTGNTKDKTHNVSSIVLEQSTLTTEDDSYTSV